MMGLIVSEVYDALIEAGASPDRARAAASSVLPADNMATKEDIANIENRMATKDDIARLEASMATKEDIARLDNDIASLDNRMATKEDVAKIEKRLAVLSFAVFSFLPPLLVFMVKLTFFP